VVGQIASDGNLLGEPKPVSQGQIAARMNTDKTTVSRRVKKAVAQGYLRDERRHGREAQLVIGEPLPIDTPILPTVAQLLGCGRGTP
jgi:MarR family